MAINFPNSPSNGDAHAGFIYNSTKGVWEASAASVPMSDSPPANPAQGDLWFDSSVAKTYIYYNDGSSSQWVQLNPSGGSDGVDGADATGGGESPVILTEPPTTIQLLNSDGTTSTVTMTAQDPEGFDITYGIAYKTTNNARPAQLSADTTINQTTGVYTFTPSTTTSNAGDFRARLSASDGVNTTTRLVDFRLEFAYANSQAAIDDGATAGIQSFLINGTSTDLYYDGNGWILYASFANDNTYDATNYPALVGNRLLYTDIVSSNGFAWNNAPGNYADGVTDTMGGYSRIAGRFAYFSSSANTAGLTISSWQGPSTASHIRTVWGNGHSGLSSGTYLFINNTQEVYDTSYYNTTPRTDDYAFNLSGTTPIWELREANGIAGIESIWFKF